MLEHLTGVWQMVSLIPIGETIAAAFRSDYEYEFESKFQTSYVPTTVAPLLLLSSREGGSRNKIGEVHHLKANKI